VNVQLLDSAVLRLLNGNVNLSGVRMSYSGVSGSASRVMVYGATPTIGGSGEVVLMARLPTSSRVKGTAEHRAGITVRTGSGSE